MPVDPAVRLRLRNRLTELLDSELADAMMETMPTTPWDQLATKDDVNRLDSRIERVEQAVVEQGDRLDAAIRNQGDRFESVMRDQGDRFESLMRDQSERLLGVIDAQGQRHAGDMAQLEGRLSVRYVETTRMIVFAMMTLFVGVVAVLVTTVN